MLLKTLLNKVELSSFIYGDSKLMTVGSHDALVIDIKPRRNSKPGCPECGERGKTYDIQCCRYFEYRFGKAEGAELDRAQVTNPPPPHPIVVDDYNPVGLHYLRMGRG